MRFDRKGKLSSRYVRQYMILQRLCDVAYHLEFPTKLASNYPVFHVSMSKKCLCDPRSILPIEGLGVDEHFSYEEVLVEILDK